MLSRSPGPYTRHVLRPSEEVITVGRFHWLYTATAVLCLLLLGRFLIGILIFARIMIVKWTTEIVITPDRLIYKRGWIVRHVEELAFDRIEEVVLDQTVIGRMLGYGRIVAAGTGRGTIRLPWWLADPVGVVTLRLLRLRGCILMKIGDIEKAIGNIENATIDLGRKHKLLSTIACIVVTAIISAGITWLVQGCFSCIFDDPFCRGIFPFSEVNFILMFILTLGWALRIYWDRRDASLQNARQENTTGFSFHELAEDHKEWAQLWFTISISIFLGGLIYAIFHVSSHICPWIDFDTDPSWNKIVSSLLPNIFIYSLFFAAWHWSSRHYRAHWHNFILNAYRHRALVKFAELEQAGNLPIGDQAQAAIAGEIRKLSGILLLIPGDSAYIDKEKEDTGAERIIKTEEIIREVFTKKE